MSGSDTELVWDGVTVAGSGSDTSNDFNTQDDSQVSLQLDGDSNSDNFDLTLQGKVRDVAGDSWTEVDASVSGEDVTGTSNNSRLYLYDVENVYKVRWVFNEKSGDSTTITGVASREG